LGRGAQLVALSESTIQLFEQNSDGAYFASQPPILERFNAWSPSLLSSDFHETFAVRLQTPDGGSKVHLFGIGNSGGEKTTLIAVGVAGGLVAVVLIAVVTGFMIKRRRRDAYEVI
jgi:hypothetical protein